MDIYEGVELMRGQVAAHDWDGLELLFAENCSRIDDEAAAAISAIDLDHYRDALESDLRRIARAVDETIAAMYWELDMDNGWASSFFPCRSYRPEAAGEDEWATDFAPSSAVSGPGMTELADQLGQTWNGSERDVVRNLYLLARTVSAFGRASRAWSAGIPLCAGHHDQWILFRVA